MAHEKLLPEGVGLLGDDEAGAGYLGFAGGEVLSGDFSKVVEVVEEDVFQVGNPGGDVARQS